MTTTEMDGLMVRVPADERAWERIPDQGSLSYWRMPLAHQRPSRLVFLAVSRSTDGRWTWALRGPESGPDGGYQVQAHGLSGTVAGAKRAAVNNVLEPHCINCGSPLDTGTADMFHCPGCGDEWSPDLWPYYL